jgi:4-oxalocrotonate tautomerase
MVGFLNWCPPFKLHEKILGVIWESAAPTEKALGQHDLQGEKMPFVNIKITKDGTSPEKKAELIQGVTSLLQDLLNKDPKTTTIVIEEIDTDNWGVGGESVTSIRSKKANL